MLTLERRKRLGEGPLSAAGIQHTPKNSPRSKGHAIQNPQHAATGLGAWLRLCQIIFCTLNSASACSHQAMSRCFPCLQEQAFFQTSACSLASRAWRKRSNRLGNGTGRRIFKFREGSKLRKGLGQDQTAPNK